MPTATDNLSFVESTLAKILPRVDKPGRYLGQESNSVYKDLTAVDFRMCLVFPDVYELGMSNTGLRLLYSLVNGDERSYAERAYCPWPDMRKEMLAHKLPLYSMETHTPLAEFDCIGYSLQTELAYTNIPYVLELAQLPVFSKDRGEGDPFVCAGGPAMANPEPIADFFDFLVIGDGEAVLPGVIALFKMAKQGHYSRKVMLHALAQLPGVYVPSLIPTVTNAFGEEIPIAALEENRALRVRRLWLDEITNELYLKPQVVPNMTPIQLRLGIEVMRGCTQGCRFCQAGYWYRPAREMAPGQVMEAMEAGLNSTGLNEFGLLSLSTADYSRLEALVNMTKKQYLKDLQVNVALPSLRADSFTATLATEMGDVHGNSLTFAPETGSERLRQFINKTITNQQMFEAAHIAYNNGWGNVKLYIMIGIPSETWEDVKSIAWLSKEMLSIGKRVRRSNTVGLNIGILSPKPFTPLQWDACDNSEALQEKINYLKGELRGLVKMSFHDIKNASIESVLARGDRRISKVIYAAYQKGASYDAWDEHFKYAAWMEAFKEAGIDPDVYRRKREFDEPLPWDVIDMGVKKGYFRKQRMLADELVTVPDCKWGHCNYCGIPGNYKDIKLAKNDLIPHSPSPSPEGLSRAVSRDGRGGEPIVSENQKPVFTYRLRYTKAGWARFLSHLDCLRLFEQAFRRTRLKFKYSEGFRPRLKISASPALPFGFESEAEYLDITLAERPPEDWWKALTEYLPRGFTVAEGHPLSPADFSLSGFDAVHCYRVTVGEAALVRGDMGGRIALWNDAEKFPIEKGTSALESKEWIKELRVEGGSLYAGVLFLQSKKSLSLNDVLRGVLGFTDLDLTECVVRKVETRMVRSEPAVRAEKLAQRSIPSYIF